MHPEALAAGARRRAPDGVPIFDDDVPLMKYALVLTRGRGRITAEMCGLLPNPPGRRPMRRRSDNMTSSLRESLGIVVVHAPAEHMQSANTGR